jgi:hypothetical protein
MTTKTIELLQEYRPLLARAIASQVQQTVPRYRGVDADALARNVDKILEGIQHLIDHGDERKVMETLSMVMSLRQVSGFTINDFVVACICALPVVRRFYGAKAQSFESGMSHYEDFESIAIPLVGRVASTFMRLADGEATSPGRVPVLPRLEDIGAQELYGSFALEIVDVDDN